MRSDVIKDSERTMRLSLTAGRATMSEGVSPA